MRRGLFGIALVGLLVGCATWGPNIPRPPQRTLEDKVEARRKEDARTKKCVLEQALRRQQQRAGQGRPSLP